VQGGGQPSRALACRAAGGQVGGVAPAQVQDAVAVAAQPLEIARDLAGVLGKQNSMASGTAAPGPAARRPMAWAAAPPGRSCDRRSWPRRRRGHGARQQRRVAAVGQFQRHAMQVDAVDAQVEVGKLRGHARVELDHRELVAAASWKNSMLNRPW
jgi:hypothetical protein